MKTVRNKALSIGVAVTLILGLLTIGFAYFFMEVGHRYGYCDAKCAPYNWRLDRDECWCVDNQSGAAWRQ